MSNPDNAAAQSSNSDAAGGATEPTFGQQVNTVVQQLTKDDKGVWQLPTDLEVPEEVKFAATLEKRRRDTESALSTARQELGTERAIREKLETRVVSQAPLQITEAEATELEALKFSDPDAWRKRVNELENKATTTLQEELTTDRTSASQEAELKRRATVLEVFNETHSDAPITDDILANDIPPRIVNKLEKGTITFEDFLTEAHEFLAAPKTTETSATTEQPNLGNAGGHTSPSDAAANKQDVVDYNKAVF